MKTLGVSDEERIAYSQGPVEAAFERKGSSEDTVTKGKWAEAVACEWLRNLGYEVFPNMRNRGPIDVVAIKNGNIRKIDVKLTAPIRVGARQSAGETVSVFGKRQTAKQKELGVEFLYVANDGFCAFSRRVMVDHLKNVAGLSAMDTKRGRSPTLKI